METNILLSFNNVIFTKILIWLQYQKKKLKLDIGISNSHVEKTYDKIESHHFDEDIDIPCKIASI